MCVYIYGDEGEEGGCPVWAMTVVPSQASDEGSQSESGNTSHGGLAQGHVDRSHGDVSVQPQPNGNTPTNAKQTPQKMKRKKRIVAPNRTENKANELFRDIRGTERGAGGRERTRASE